MGYVREGLKSLDVYVTVTSHDIFIYHNLLKSNDFFCNMHVLSYELKK